MTDSLQRLVTNIATYVGMLHAPAGDMRDALEHLRAAAERARPRPFAAVPHGYAQLVRAAAELGLHGKVAAIAQALHALHAPLPWVYHYPPRTASENLGERIAFAELIGPDGPMMAPRCRIGFTVMAPHTTYPLHTHPAVELYLVVAGTALWRNDESASRMPPGELVLHRTNEPHAMQTFDEPLLALWGWSGDLDSPSVYA